MELCTGDLTDRASLDRALAGVDIVYNIGATYRQASASRDEYRAINAQAVGDLVEAGALAGVRRVVHCSTVGVHGDVEQPPAGEDAPLRPGDEYQRSKLDGERLGREAAARTGLDLVIARPTGIYGPGDRRLLKLFRGVARRRFVTLGSGEIFYHLTYVDDLVEGFRLCGVVPAASGRTYILAGGEVTSLNELVRRIATAAGVPPPAPRPGVARLARRRGLRGAVRAAGHRTAPVPPARGLLHEEPRVRHLPRSSGTGLCPDGEPRRGHPPHAGLVPRTGVAVMAGIPKAQDQLFDAGSSSLDKYARLVVGRAGWLALLKHEAITLVSQAVPGALGLVLRKLLYPRLLGACGRNVVFGQNVVLRHPGKIRIGDNVVVDDNCLLDAKGDGNSGIAIGSGVFVGRNTILSCKNGDISLGDRANIGFNCEIFSASRVTLGADALLAAYCYVIGGDHDYADVSKPVIAQGRQSKGVSIGEGVWMGAGAKILDGVRVGGHAIIGAGAVVRVDVPEYAVAAGRPARIVGMRGDHEAPAE